MDDFEIRAIISTFCMTISSHLFNEKTDSFVSHDHVMCFTMSTYILIKKNHLYLYSTLAINLYMFVIQVTFITQTFCPKKCPVKWIVMIDISRLSKIFSFP